MNFAELIISEAASLKKDRSLFLMLKIFIDKRFKSLTFCMKSYLVEMMFLTLVSNMDARWLSRLWLSQLGGLLLR